MSSAAQQTAVAAGAEAAVEPAAADRAAVVDAVLERGPVGLPPWLRRACWLLAGLGLAALAVGLLAGEAAWTVTALLVASLVVAGAAQVGVIWSAVFEMTNARWGRSYRRLAELSLAAAPVALLGLLVLLVSAPWWVPFADMHLPGGKGVWLSLPFWALRNGLAVLGLFLLSLVYLRHCLRPDLGLAARRGKAFSGWLAARCGRDFGDPDAEIARAARQRKRLAPVLCLAYAFVYSMVGFDLVMALDVWWYSTLFGAYHFTGNVYLGLALLILLAVVLRHRLGQPRFFSAKHFGIAGAMLFAFCFLMGDFFWSQFLTIHYADLPEEAGWVIQRTMDPELPYAPLAWAVLAGFFGIPFLALLFRAVKWVPRRLAAVALVVVLAMIAERFLTAAPPLLALEPGAAAWRMWLPLGLSLIAALGALGAGALLLDRLMRQVPLLPITDPLLLASLEDEEERP